jgi:hypothetical protein
MWHRCAMRGFVLAGLLLLVACAPQRAAREDLARVKTIGVVSAVGDLLRFQTVGMIAPGQDIKDANIEAWRIDDMVEAHIVAALGRRYDARPIPAARAALSSASGAKVAEAARAALGGAGMDAYLVVSKEFARVGSSNQSVRGAGVLRWNRGLTTQYHAHALYRLTLVDGRNFGVLADRSSVQLTLFFSAATAIDGPSRQVDASYWIDAPEKLTNDQQQLLRTAIRAILEQNLPNTLRDAGLTEPPPAAR